MEYDWIEMMERMQDIRLFCSLHVRRAKKGGISSAQELDLLSRVCLLYTSQFIYLHDYLAPFTIASQSPFK